MEPVISHLGADLGANVFFTRLAGHGRDGAAMAEATVEDWLADAVEALAVGARLGDRVVLDRNEHRGDPGVLARGSSRGR